VKFLRAVFSTAFVLRGAEMYHFFHVRKKNWEGISPKLIDLKSNWIFINNFGCSTLLVRKDRGVKTYQIARHMHAGTAWLGTVDWIQMNTGIVARLARRNPRRWEKLAIRSSFWWRRMQTLNICRHMGGPPAAILFQLKLRTYKYRTNFHQMEFVFQECL
jgi:hypothetical protein